VVIVEPDFADGEAARVGNECLEPGKILGRGLVRFCGWIPAGREDLGMCVRQFQRAVHRLWPVADADGEELSTPAARACARIAGRSS